MTETPLSARVEELYRRGIILVGTPPDTEGIALTGPWLSHPGLSTILQDPGWLTLQAPVIIRVDYLTQLMEEEHLSLYQAVGKSRFSFLGTDGIRGKVQLSSESPSAQIDRAAQAALSAQELANLAIQGILTPYFIQAAARGFASMLNDREMGRESSDEPTRIFIASDGRDRAWDNRFHQALVAGIAAAGTELIDLGILPTPFLPTRIAQEGGAGGIMLTASHNPADQNGVKFFIKDSKPLPEGPLGEYSISAYILQGLLAGGSSHGQPEKATPVPNQDSAQVQSRVEAPSQPRPTQLISPRTTQAPTASWLYAWMEEVLPAGIHPALRRATLVVDDAKGAFAQIAPGFLRHLGLHCEAVNPASGGRDINQHCGVAEIEGAAVVPASEYEQTTRAVQRVFELGRAGTPSFGIVLDGDGDRGFVLAHNPWSDEVRVLGGDVCGYLLARKWRRDHPDSKGRVICTVESDLMVIQALESRLELLVDIEPVGDKWISNRAREPDFVLGFEASGHVILPGPVASGNGLVTCISVLNAIQELGLSAEAAYQPFTPGFQSTHYTYFINKDRFSPGSRVWDMDKAIIIREFEGLRSARKLPQNSSLNFPNSKDPGLLLAEVRRPFAELDLPLASIFCRNSGTENKCGVYIKADPSLGSVFEDLGKLLAQNHAGLKDANLPEVQWEQRLLTALDQRGEVSMDEAPEVCEMDSEPQDPENSPDTQGGQKSAPTNQQEPKGLQPFLYALVKQGSVRIHQNKIQRNQL